jgi:hypothetical protein
MFVLGPGHVDGQRLEEPAVASEAEDVIDPVRLAPRHRRLAGEAVKRSDFLDTSKNRWLSCDSADSLRL